MDVLTEGDEIGWVRNHDLRQACLRLSAVRAICSIPTAETAIAFSLHFGRDDPAGGLRVQAALL